MSIVNDTVNFLNRNIKKLKDKFEREVEVEVVNNLDGTGIDFNEQDKIMKLKNILDYPDLNVENL